MCDFLFYAKFVILNFTQIEYNAIGQTKRIHEKYTFTQLCIVMKEKANQDTNKRIKIA